MALKHLLKPESFGESVGHMPRCPWKHPGAPRRAGVGAGPGACPRGLTWPSCRCRTWCGVSPPAECRPMWAQCHWTPLGSCLPLDGRLGLDLQGPLGQAPPWRGIFCSLDLGQRLLTHLFFEYFTAATLCWALGLVLGSNGEQNQIRSLCS